MASDTKKELYETVLKQTKALLDAEKDFVANMANTAALIHSTFGFWWTGFYRVEGQQLVLGPFQGPPACTRIGFGKGVCGTSWKNGSAIIVPDVELFPGHIACSAASKSEIVVPIIKNGEVKAVIDIDSAELNTFDEEDQHYLEMVADCIAATI